MDYRSGKDYKTCHKFFNQWKREHNYTCKCVVHHRDDTEETRAYNKTYYERWGCNEDGTFEYGKYVIFMTVAEHNKHHKTGAQHTADTKARISATLKGHVKSSETRERLSKSLSGEKNPMYGTQWSTEKKAHASKIHKRIMQGIKFLYETYRDHNGKLNWNQFQRALRTGEITFEMLPNTIYTNGVHNES